jgi:hypothetical protein
MATAKKKGPRFPDAVSGRDKVVAYGYVGRFIDGTIGWCVPRYLDGSRHRSVWIGPVEPYMQGETFDLCRITVEVIPGARKKHVR